MQKNYSAIKSRRLYAVYSMILVFVLMVGVILMLLAFYFKQSGSTATLSFTIAYAIVYGIAALTAVRFVHFILYPTILLTVKDGKLFVYKPRNTHSININEIDKITAFPGGQQPDEAAAYGSLGVVLQAMASLVLFKANLTIVANGKKYKIFYLLEPDDAAADLYDRVGLRTRELVKMQTSGMADSSLIQQNSLPDQNIDEVKNHRI